MSDEAAGIRGMLVRLKKLDDLGKLKDENDDEPAPS